MNVYIHDQPLAGGHSLRGIGSYTRELLSSLEKRNDVTVIRSSTREQIPENTDIVHYPYFDLFSSTLKIPDRLPVVVTVHDVIPLVFPQHFPAGIRGRVHLWRQKRALHGADKIITDSQSSKKDIVHHLGIAKSSVDVVPLAASDAYIKTPLKNSRSLDLHSKYSLPKKYLLYVGDVNWNKNVDGLIRAFEKLQPHKKHVSLVLVGGVFENKKQHEIQKLSDLISSCGLDKYVQMLGYVPIDDLVQIYSSAALYVQPSHYEGFGLPVLEAMACGVPIVSTTGGSLGELLPDEALHTHPDPQSLAKSIDEGLALSQERRRRIGKRLKQHARSYSWDQTAKKTVAVYKRIVAYT